MSVVLREVRDDDLPVFFEHQQDHDACWMAAFVAPDPSDREAFEAHWARIRGSDAVCVRTIVHERRVVGHVASFEAEGRRELTYWIGRESWGRGIATEALRSFLELETTRPVYARVAHDNRGSARVLDKCGFEIVGHDRGFAHARGELTDESVWMRP